MQSVLERQEAEKDFLNPQMRIEVIQKGTRPSRSQEAVLCHGAARDAFIGNGIVNVSVNSMKPSSYARTVMGQQRDVLFSRRQKAVQLAGVRLRKEMPKKVFGMPKERNEDLIKLFEDISRSWG